MKTLLVVNPMSGARGQRWRNLDLPGTVQGFFPEATLHLTQSENDATEAARFAVAEGFDLVIAVGGDGTINEVMNGLVGSPVQLGILPAGTENVLAKERHIPSSLEKAAQYLREAPPRKADVARVTSGVSETSSRRVGHFLCFAGVGFDALIVEKIQPELKARLGAMAYVMTGFDHMFKYQEVNRVATIQVDDQPPQSFAFWQIIIANIQTYGGGLRPAPRASMHDGLLDLILWPRADLAGTIHQVVATATGAHLGLPDVKYIQGQRFWIDTEPASMIQIDGDLLGPTPVLIEVLPQALWTRF